MQSTKDTFYLAIRDRLAALAPERKVVVDGVERPAVLVAENEPVNAAPPLPGVYYLAWGPPQIVTGSENAACPLMKLECRLSYRAACTIAGGADRGRALTARDAELLRLCTPPRTAKLNAAVSPPVASGSFIFWGVPSLEDVNPPAPTGFARAGEQNALGRAATLTIFFFPEVEA